MSDELQKLKIRELELKSRGFDIQQEQEALTARLNQLQSEKVKITVDLKELYKIAENFQKAIKEAVMKKEAIMKEEVSLVSGELDKELGCIIEEDPEKKETSKKEVKKIKTNKKSKSDKTNTTEKTRDEKSIHNL